jgi:tRNA(fMet)-specific endonuclease VapC
MSGRVLLDTNIVIAIFAGELPVLERMAAAEEVFVPAVVLGELYYGARKSGVPKRTSRVSTNLPPLLPY